MADLTVTAADVALVESPRQPRTFPAGAAVDAGAPVYLDTNGMVREADAGADATEMAIGIATTSAAAANLPVNVAGPDSIVDLGDALGDLAYGAAVYLSDTAGALADAAGSASVVMGHVIPAWGHTTADKLLRVAGGLQG
jgi:hypothetical protein